MSLSGGFNRGAVKFVQRKAVAVALSVAAAATSLAPTSVAASPTFSKWLCLGAGVGINDDTTACAENGQADGVMYYDDNTKKEMAATRYLEGPIDLAAYNSLTETTNIAGIQGWRTSNTYGAVDGLGNGLTDLYQLVSAYNDFGNQNPGQSPLDFFAAFAPDSSGWASPAGSILDTNDYSNPASLTYTFNPNATADGWAFLSITRDGNNVPEPSTLALGGLALAGLALSRRKQSAPAAGM